MSRLNTKQKNDQGHITKMHMFVKNITFSL